MKTFCHENQQFCSPPLRKKRFLGIAAALFTEIAGVGIGVTNAVHVHGRDSKISALNLDLQDSNKLTFSNTKTIYKLTKANQQTYSFLNHAMQEVTEMIEQVRCNEHLYTSRVHQQLVGYIFRENAKHTVEAAMSAISNGVVSPSLIDVSMLNKLFTGHRELTTSLLSREPNLVYQFARIYPVNVDIYNFRFAFIRARTI